MTFGPNSASTIQSVSKGLASLSLTANNSSSTFGQALFFSASLTTPFADGATPTGSAQFAVDGKNFGTAIALINGSATSMSTQNLPVGPHTVTVSYSGDSTYMTSSGSIVVTVGTGTTSQFVVIPPAPPSVAVGTPLPITFVAEDRGGNVTAGYSGTVQLASTDPAASLSPINYTFTTSDAGSHTFNVTFNTAGTQTLKLADSANGISQTVQVSVTAAVNPLPILTGVTPNSTPAGSSNVPITVTGSNFVASSTIEFKGVAAHDQVRQRYHVDRRSSSQRPDGRGYGINQRLHAGAGRRHVCFADHHTHRSCQPAPDTHRSDAE